MEPSMEETDGSENERGLPKHSSNGEIPDSQFRISYIKQIFIFPHAVLRIFPGESLRAGEKKVDFFFTLDYYFILVSSASFVHMLQTLFYADFTLQFSFPFQLLIQLTGIV